MDTDNDAEDDILGGSSLGLSRVLASAGVDTSTLSRFLPTSSSQQGINDIDAESDNEDKYEDDISEHELAPESSADAARREREQRDQERWIRRAMAMQAQVNKAGKAEDAAEKKARQRQREWEEIKRVWPTFEKGKRLKMSEVFYETPQMRQDWARELKRAKRRRVQPREVHVMVAQDERPNPQTSWLGAHLPPVPDSAAHHALYARPLGRYFDRDWIKGARESRRRAMWESPSGLRMDDQGEDRSTVNGSEAFVEPPAEWRNLDLLDWEKEIITAMQPAPKKQSPNLFAPRNNLLDEAKWLNEIVWDARRVSPDLVESDEDVYTAVDSTTTQAIQIGRKGVLDSLNISNDHLYEQPREARFRIRQTFGAIEVFHSYPAKILQLPWYKTSLSKAEARAWKRPAMQFPSGVWLGFHKLKPNPTSGIRKKQTVADPAERFKASKDLTLTEKGPFILLEFSEEYPPIMSSWGMGTTIVNYYRKKNDQDESVPKLDFGQPSILNPGDGEPYLLGYVDRGKVTQILHNNLIRAPLYRHEPETTDFLVIRQTINGHSTYYLRPINNIYTVGQTTPNDSEIPGPHARKNTNTAKMRLQQVAWLIMDQSHNKKLQIKQLIKYFPDQTELQMRQRLKIKGNEFLMYDRSEKRMGPRPGGHAPYWMINPEYDFPKDRASVVELVPPEHAALYEAMQVGQRHLHDAGYSKAAEGNAEDEYGDDTTLDIEQQLAVWSTTLNYKRAEAQKAWLVVHGEGDPTGRGEGWSFLRANMKGYFLRKGETEVGRRIEAENKAGGNPTKISNAEQNRIYEEEKRRVWDLQAKALSNPHPPSITAEEAAAAEHAPTPQPFMSRMPRVDSRRSMSRLSKTATPFGGRSRSQSVVSETHSADGGESSWTGNQFAGKVMRITRIVKGKQVAEIVRDPAIMAAYARRATEAKIEAIRQAATGKDGDMNLFQRTGDEVEDQIRQEALRRELQRSELNQQRRAARRKYTSGVLADPDDSDSKRRCGACGQMGHTKANRMCPMYGASVGPSPVASTPGLTPGGYTPVGYGNVGGYFGAPPGQGGSGGGGDYTMDSPADMGGTKIKLKLGAKKE